VPPPTLRDLSAGATYPGPNAEERLKLDSYKDYFARANEAAKPHWITGNVLLREIPRIAAIAAGHQPSSRQLHY